MNDNPVVIVAEYKGFQLRLTIPRYKYEMMLMGSNCLGMSYEAEHKRLIESILNGQVRYFSAVSQCEELVSFGLNLLDDKLRIGSEEFRDMVIAVYNQDVSKT